MVAVATFSFQRSLNAASLVRGLTCSRTGVWPVSAKATYETVGMRRAECREHQRSGAHDEVVPAETVVRKSAGRLSSDPIPSGPASQSRGPRRSLNQDCG